MAASIFEVRKKSIFIFVAKMFFFSVQADEGFWLYWCQIKNVKANILLFNFAPIILASYSELTIKSRLRGDNISTPRCPGNKDESTRYMI